MTTLLPYMSLFRLRFQLLLQYRAAAIAGAVTQLFWGLIQIMIMTAFYQSTTTAMPMALDDVITYKWLGQAFLVMLPWNLDKDIAAMIRNGNVAYELTRPLDLYKLWYSRMVAMRTAPMLLRAVPILILAGLFFQMQAPPSWPSFAAWGVSMVGALALGCAFSVLLTITLLWTLAGEGITITAFAAVMILSGMIVPLPLFPDWAQTALTILPFSSMVDLPYRLYLGHLPPEALLWVLPLQLGWTAVIVLTGRLLLARGLQRLVVQGG